MGGFTFDGVHSSTYGIKAKAIPSLAPSTRDREESVPGRDGVWYFGSEFDKRPLEIECTVKGTSRTDFLAKCEQIAAWLNPKKGERKLILDEKPDKYCMARYSGSIPLEQLVVAGKFTVPFMSSDPYFYSNLAEAVSWSATANNQTQNIQMEARNPEEYPIIRIVNSGTAPVSNITITRVNTP